MTKYEILDLRATYGERLTSMAKFWLTLTFAVFGSAYYIQDNPDTFSKVALVLFYGVTSFLSAQTLYSIIGFIGRLAAEEPEARDEGSIDARGQDPLTTHRPRQTVKALFLVMGLSFLALCFYVFRPM